MSFMTWLNFREMGLRKRLSLLVIVGLLFSQPIPLLANDDPFLDPYNGSSLPHDLPSTPSDSPEAHRFTGIPLTNPVPEKLYVTEMMAHNARVMESVAQALADPALHDVDPEFQRIASKPQKVAAALRIASSHDYAKIMNANINIVINGEEEKIRVAKFLGDHWGVDIQNSDLVNPEQKKAYLSFISKFNNLDDRQTGKAIVKQNGILSPREQAAVIRLLDIVDKNDRFMYVKEKVRGARYFANGSQKRVPEYHKKMEPTSKWITKGLTDEDREMTTRERTELKKQLAIANYVEGDFNKTIYPQISEKFSANKFFNNYLKHLNSNSKKSFPRLQSHLVASMTEKVGEAYRTAYISRVSSRKHSPYLTGFLKSRNERAIVEVAEQMEHLKPSRPSTPGAFGIFGLVTGVSQILRAMKEEKPIQTLAQETLASTLFMDTVNAGDFLCQNPSLSSYKDSQESMDQYFKDFPLDIQTSIRKECSDLDEILTKRGYPRIVEINQCKTSKTFTVGFINRDRMTIDLVPHTNQSHTSFAPRRVSIKKTTYNKYEFKLKPSWEGEREEKTGEFKFAPDSQEPSRYIENVVQISYPKAKTQKMKKETANLFLDDKPHNRTYLLSEGATKDLQFILTHINPLTRCCQDPLCVQEINSGGLSTPKHPTSQKQSVTTWVEQ